MNVCSCCSHNVSSEIIPALAAIFSCTPYDPYGLAVKLFISDADKTTFLCHFNDILLIVAFVESTLTISHSKRFFL